MNWFQKILLKFLRFLCVSLPIKLFQKIYEKAIIHYYKPSVEPSIESLVEPLVKSIRRALDYQGIGRKLFFVDELPQGAYARYQNELNQTITSIQSNVNQNAQINFYTTPTATTSTISTSLSFYDTYLNPNIHQSNVNMGTIEKPLATEENSLNQYLIKLQEIKDEKMKEEKRKEMSFAINSLEI